MQWKVFSVLELLLLLFLRLKVFKSLWAINFLNVVREEVEKHLKYANVFSYTYFELFLRSTAQRCEQSENPGFESLWVRTLGLKLFFTSFKQWYKIHF